MTSSITEARLKKTEIGEMPEHWNVVRSGQLYSERKEPGIPGLPVMSVTLDRGLVPRSSLDRRVESDLEARDHALVRKGDLVYNTMRMWQGASGVAATDCLVSPAYVVAAPDDQILPAFASFLFKSPEAIRRLHSHSQGITRDRLRLYFDNFEEVPIPLPPLTEQRKIAAILSSVDDAVAATRKVIDQVKRVKQGLLQTLMTRGIGHTRFKKTEIGEIPEGWEVVKLDEVAVRGSGHTPSKQFPEYWDGDIKWVSLADSQALDRVYLSDTDKTITPKGIANSSAVVHPAGTVLVSRDASVGRSAIAACDLAVSQHFIAWQCGERLNNHFLYYFLQYHKPQLERIAVGSTIKTIGLSYFKRLRLPLPPRPEQDAVADSLLSYDRSVWAQESLAGALERIKRGLMQDLLTGRVRVPLD